MIVRKRNKTSIFRDKTHMGQKKENPKKSRGLFGSLLSIRSAKKKESIWDDELEEELDMDEDMEGIEKQIPEY